MPADVPGADTAEAGPSTVETAEPVKRERRQRDLDAEDMSRGFDVRRDKSVRFLDRRVFSTEEELPEREPPAGKRPKRAAGAQPVASGKLDAGDKEEEGDIAQAVAASLHSMPPSASSSRKRRRRRAARRRPP